MDHHFGHSFSPNLEEVVLGHCQHPEKGKIECWGYCYGLYNGITKNNRRFS